MKSCDFRNTSGIFSKFPQQIQNYPEHFRKFPNFFRTFPEQFCIFLDISRNFPNKSGNFQTCLETIRKFPEQCEKVLDFFRIFSGTFRIFSKFFFSIGSKGSHTTSAPSLFIIPAAGACTLGETFRELHDTRPARTHTQLKKPWQP